MTLFDSHCHLTDRAYITSIDEIIQRANTNSVNYLLTAGLDINDSLASIKIAEKYQNVYCSVGIHPHDADKFQQSDIDKLKNLATNPKVKAIGETGLDFFKNYSERTNQEKAFHFQIELAKEINLPMIIHIRDAYPEAQQILESHNYFDGVLHCYSGDEQFALWAIEKGFYISFSGSITYNNPKLKEIARILPAASILIETDAPYLAPVPMRGKRNEPSYVKYVAQTIAQIRKIPTEHLAEITTKNTKSVFRI